MKLNVIVIMSVEDVISYILILIVKKRIKIDYINKLFNINIESVLTNNQYNYRNKATFHVKDGKIGYYSEKDK
ncbi:MAG: hypothetical protein L6V81_02100 [Clostridium sp.]|nr:MAG: hypothetical protein L6V81_02100 [Clostridium sp.]